MCSAFTKQNIVLLCFFLCKFVFCVFFMKKNLLQIFIIFHLGNLVDPNYFNRLNTFGNNGKIVCMKSKPIKINQCNNANNQCFVLIRCS